MINYRLSALALVACLLCACGGSDQPDVPVATLQPLSGELSGEVEVGYVLSDPQSRLVNVTFYFGASSGVHQPATLATGSAGTQGLATSPGTPPYTFTWDTITDIDYDRKSVYLSVFVSAGPLDGIGDEIGPLVVDNTNIVKDFDISGNICKVSEPTGDQTGDLSGKLYIGLFSDANYPPFGAPVDSLDLGNQDLSGPCVPYQFTDIEPGNYQLISILDDNNNGTIAGGFSIDEGDLTNLSGTQVQVVASDIVQDVSLNYFCTPPLCPL